MDTYKIFALSCNFIIYLFMLTPIFYLLFKKAIYENKKTFI